MCTWSKKCKSTSTSTINKHDHTTQQMKDREITWTSQWMQKSTWLTAPNRLNEGKLSDLKQGKNGHFDHAFIQPGTGSHRAIKQEKKQRASNLEEEVKLSLFVGDMISIQKTRKADKVAHVCYPRIRRAWSRRPGRATQQDSVWKTQGREKERILSTEGEKEGKDRRIEGQL